MATAGIATVTTSGSWVFNNEDGATVFCVEVESTSANDALVNIPGLHDADEFFKVVAGSSRDFKYNSLGIKKVFVKGDGGDASIIYGVVEKD